MSRVKIFEEPRYGIYAKYIKRILDFIVSLIAVIVFSPLILCFTVVGAIKMRGNPFLSRKRR